MTTAALSPGSLNIVNLERFKDTVLFSIGLRRWNNRAQVKDMASLQKFIAELEAREGEPNGEVTDKNAPAIILASDRVKSNKILIRSKTYEALCREMNEIKAWCLERSMPSYFRSGMFVVRSDQVGNVEKALREKLAALVAPDGPLEKFLAAYPADVETARTAPVKKGGLGPLFRQNDYPDANRMREMFTVDWYWLALGVPENIPDELREEAGEKFKRRLMDAAQDIETALRSEFMELLSHAEERLTAPPGEKSKVFRDSMIGNLLQFVNTFDSKDVFGDSRLADVVAKARATLLDEKGNARITAGKLREYASVRDVARETFSKLKMEIETMIEDSPSRKFDFSED